jgi:hypothetical protein
VLEIQGIPPGLFDPSVLYDTRKIRIEESFGIERLQAACEERRQSSPTELLGHVFSEVERFARGRAQHDEMVAAVFRCCDEQGGSIVELSATLRSGRLFSRY